jgi:alkanesulfonate monooxygenase SsuD/methylene tetrahydromethanopterin reductase-like flavin-dependent oxidoreductase (luciferase family)
MMGTHVAARTKNLRIGTAVSLAGFYHPLRLAEEIALLDVLSGGRVNWGAGRGFDATEFRAFGVKQEESAERFLEAVEIVQLAWRDERLSFHGKFWDFENIDVLPKPLQKLPPVWVAATSPESIERAAARGHTILMDPHASHREIGRKRELYREALGRHGYSEEGRTIPVARLLAVAATDAEAEEVARQGAAWTVGSYASPLGKQMGIDRSPEDDPIERYVRDVVIHGTPQRVADEVIRLREEAHVDYLMCAPLSHESFLLFTEKVIPHLVGI